MALARLHGGPLDGQIIPLDDAEQDMLVVPYSETQVSYRREGEAQNTGDNDGPTEVAFWFAEASDDINPSDD